MTRGKGGVVRVGMGSSVYSFVGKWVPRGLVAFMMGNRPVGEGMETEFGRGELVRSRSTSPGSNGRTGDSEYIAVYGDGHDDEGYGGPKLTGLGHDFNK